MPLALVVLANPVPVKPALLLSTVPSTEQNPELFSCTSMPYGVLPPEELELELDELDDELELLEDELEVLELDVLELLELLELELLEEVDD